MASVSPFRIQLSDQQWRERERRAQAYTNPYCPVVRAKTIRMA